MVVLLVYSSFLVHKKPYTDSVMNLLEPILISMLLLLGVFGIINATYLTSNDDNIRSFLVIIDYIKVAVLVLPLPLWIGLIVVCKKLEPSTRQVHTQTQTTVP